MKELQELYDLKNEVSNLKDEVSKLREDIQQLIITCGRMDNHISFVDGVYSTVRKPLEFIVNRLPFQSRSQSLPEIVYGSDQNILVPGAITL